MLSRNDGRAGTAGEQSFDRGLDGILVHHPTLCEYLTQTKWDDGKKRETSTLTVCVDDGRLKAALNDRAQRRSLWVSATTLAGLLDALETLVQSGEGEWRKWTR